MTASVLRHWQRMWYKEPLNCPFSFWGQDSGQVGQKCYKLYQSTFWWADYVWVTVFLKLGFQLWIKDLQSSCGSYECNLSSYAVKNVTTATTRHNVAQCNTQALPKMFPKWRDTGLCTMTLLQINSKSSPVTELQVCVCLNMAMGVAEPHILQTQCWPVATHSRQDEAYTLALFTQDLAIRQFLRFKT